MLFYIILTFFLGIIAGTLTGLQAHNTPTKITNFKKYIQITYTKQAQNKENKSKIPKTKN